MKASSSQEINDFHSQKNKKKVLYSISFMLFIDSIGVGIIFPILPKLFFGEHLSLISGSASHRAFLYSLTLATYPFMEFFGMSFFGNMSDKYGRQHILLLGLSAVMIGYFLGVLAIIQKSFILFLIARGLGGFLGGMYSVGNALVSDLSSSDQKERFFNFRLPSLADKLGMTIGPALSIFIVANSYLSNELAIPYCIATILAFLNFILLFFNFKKYTTSQHHQKLISQEHKKQYSSSRIKWLDLFNAIYTIIRKKKTRFLALSFLAFQLGSSLFTQGVSLYLTLNFDYSPSQIGLFSSIMSILLVSSIYGLTKLLKKYDCYAQLKVAFYILGIFFLYAFIDNETNIALFPKSTIPVWIISSLFFIMLPIVKLSFTTLFSESVSQRQQGLIMGSVGQITALGYFLSALFVGHAVLIHAVIFVSSFTFFCALYMLYHHFQRQST